MTGVLEEGWTWKGEMRCYQGDVTRIVSLMKGLLHP